MIKSPVILALGLVASLGAAGCRTPVATGGATAVGGAIGKLNPMTWGADDGEPRSGAPERVVATWVDTIRQTPGEPSERGFGGRIYFHDRGPDPITIDGRLVVYAFDEEGRDPTDHKPTRRYIFPAEQLANHMSVSEVGPSYSVWLPWGSTEGPPTEVSLITRFEPTRGGGLVVSEPARQRLPGQGIATPDSGREMLAESPGPNGVRQAGFDAGAENVPSTARATTPSNEPRKRLSTTTIRLQR